MSGDNGAPTWTVGRRETDWLGHRVVYRSPRRQHNAWAELHASWAEQLIHEPIPAERLDPVYEALESHLVSVGGVPASDWLEDCTPLEAFGLFSALLLGVPPTGREQGESGAPSP
jgi:hypothetical protein